MDPTTEVATKGGDKDNRPASSASEFWSELNATIDEFFTVIQSSNARLTELTSEIVKRDSLIALLEAQNTALKARLGIAETAAPKEVVALNLAPVPANYSADARPSGPGPARSIWHRLSKLDGNL